MKLDKHYTDPRLVELYDHDNPRGADTDFYLTLAAELNAHRIIDLGCGTGLLTCELATGKRQVIGIDPSPAMLAVAQRKPEAERVEWVVGDASVLGERNADLLTMTGNVAQIFLDDADWAATLCHIHKALRPGGYVAFESRNPTARAWKQWGRDETFEEIETPFGSMACWLEVLEVQDGQVHFVGHNLFKATGEDVVAHSTLRFRSHTELADSLRQAGFTVDRVYGDWHHGAFTDASRLMIFVARRNEPAEKTV
ncbi:MAG: class I SAM-dependent methyltransferase [Ardenticatenaceae bacterium]|nr:class I SAM-dependent methyltransferase [Ardenticatenaceae bacterium]